MFCVRDGPIDRWFCDANCSVKFATYRHMIGVEHVVKMDSRTRAQYLKGITIDEFISNGMCVK